MMRSSTQGHEAKFHLFLKILRSAATWLPCETISRLSLLRADMRHPSSQTIPPCRAPERLEPMRISRTAASFAAIVTYISLDGCTSTLSRAFGHSVWSLPLETSSFTILVIFALQGNCGQRMSFTETLAA